MALQKAVSKLFTIHPALIAPYSFEGQGNGVLAKHPVEVRSILTLSMLIFFHAH
jgi:hypothetical protein